MTRRWLASVAAGCGTAVVLLLPGIAGAQTSGSGAHAAHTPAQLGFLTRYGFHLEVRRFLVTSDRQFSWDADIGADIDLFDLDVARGNFFANFESIIGREFNPNQGNYTLDGSLWLRTGVGELGGIFHHVSRHLSDRSSDEAVSWNMLGAEYGGLWLLGPAELMIGARGLKVIDRSSVVDYDAELGGYASFIWSRGSRFSPLFRAEGTLVPVDGGLHGRDRLSGGRLEAGVRILGERGALEVFAGREERIDADPVRREPARWTEFGVRFTSR